MIHYSGVSGSRGSFLFCKNLLIEAINSCFSIGYHIINSAPSGSSTLGRSGQFVAVLGRGVRKTNGIEAKSDSAFISLRRMIPEPPWSSFSLIIRQGKFF